MANVGNKGKVRYEEAFSAVTIGTGLIGLDGGTNSLTTSYGLCWVQSLDTGGVSYTRSMSATKGLHLAGTTGTTDNALTEFSGDKLMFYGQTGFTAAEALVQFDVAGAVAFNFGFTDEVTCASDTLPVELGTATLVASGCTTFCGLVFDTDADNDEIHCAWVDDGTVVTTALGDLRMKGMTLTADKWLFLRVEMQDQGSGKPVRATFHAIQDGRHVTKEFATTVDRDCALAYYFGVENRAGTTHGVYIKAPAWEQSIAD
uniref:Uncharacterized protein n=1 Tax=viral metagenome TaxID=1070528 RepID=A0A6M3J831_9ZZZZ